MILNRRTLIASLGLLVPAASVQAATAKKKPPLSKLASHKHSAIKTASAKHHSKLNLPPQT